jgi:hypothetical protein
MKFANIKELNDIEWEVPGEFRNVLQNNQIFHSPSSTIDSTTYISWQHEMNINQTHYLPKDDITQQQALEY